MVAYRNSRILSITLSRFVTTYSVSHSTYFVYCLRPEHLLSYTYCWRYLFYRTGEILIFLRNLERQCELYRRVSAVASVIVEHMV
jgi:hypothetical protein